MAGEFRIATDLDRLFGGIADHVAAIVDEECRAGRDRVLERARALMPVGETGDLRDGLREHGPYGIDNDVPYAKYAHLRGSSVPAFTELVAGPLEEEAAGPIAEAIARRIAAEV